MFRIILKGPKSFLLTLACCLPLLVSCSSSSVSSQPPHLAVATSQSTLTASSTRIPLSTLQPATVTITTKPTVLPTQTETLVPDWTPTLPPTRTPIVVPTLAAHTWQAQPVLIQLSWHGGDGGSVFLQNNTSHILYSDGRLLVERQVEAGNQWFETTLNRRDMCALLNTIEQVGLLEYKADPEANPVLESWLDPEMPDVGEGGPWANLQVNAWKSNQVGFDHLDSFMKALEGLPEEKMEHYVGFALYATYQLLDHYPWPELKPLQPEGVVLNLYLAPPGLQDAGMAWPLDSISLAQLAERDQPGGMLELRGAEAKSVYELFTSAERGNAYVFSEVFHEGGEAFVVQLRPLLPYQSMAGFLADSSQVPSVDVPLPPSVELTCAPSDGLLPIP